MAATVGAYNGSEGIVGRARSGSGRPIIVGLDEELVHIALALTNDPTGTLNDPIRELVTRERARRLTQDESMGKVICCLDAVHRTHGLLSEEFPPL